MRSRLVADDHGAQSACDDRTVDAIWVAEHIARGLIPRECFCDLARNAFRGRMCCDTDPDQLSAIQPHYDEGVEQVETNGRDNEQVHGGDCGSLLRWRLSLTLSSSAHFWTISLEKLLS